MGDVLLGFRHWIEKNPALATILISIALSPFVFLFRWWLAHTRLEYSLEAGDIPGKVILRVANVGGREAADVRVLWEPHSEMEMSLIPQSGLIGLNESLRIPFTMSPDDFWSHCLTDARSRSHSPLGFVRVSHRTLWRRSKGGRMIEPFGEFKAGPISTCMSLGRIPRSPLAESRLARWFDEATGRKKSREEGLNHSQILGQKLHLAEALKSIEEAGIILPNRSYEEKAHLLLGELSTRGWDYGFEPHGSGYSVQGTKYREPTISDSFRSWGRTLYEAGIYALDMAMSHDLNYSQRTGPMWGKKEPGP